MMSFGAITTARRPSWDEVISTPVRKLFKSAARKKTPTAKSTTASQGHGSDPWPPRRVGASKATKMGVRSATCVRVRKKQRRVNTRATAESGALTNHGGEERCALPRCLRFASSEEKVDSGTATERCHDRSAAGKCREPRRGTALRVLVLKGDDRVLGVVAGASSFGPDPHSSSSDSLSLSPSQNDKLGSLLESESDERALCVSMASRKNASREDLRVM